MVLKYNMVFIYILITLNISLIVSKGNTTDILVLKFKTYYPQTDNMRKNNSIYNSNDFIDSFLFSEIYLELENNNNNQIESNQILKTIVKAETSSFILRNPQNHFSFCTFNSSLSSTFKSYSQNPAYCQSEDTFKIYTDLSFTKFKMGTFEFDNYFCLNESICGEIGMDISSYKKTLQNSKDFILKMNNLLNSGEQNFAFHFSKEDPEEGIFVFGEMPHNYFKDKYNENDIISFYSDAYDFEIILDTISFNGKEYHSNKTENEDYYDYINIKITPDFEGIEFDKFFMDILINIYFNKYIEKNICKIEHFVLNIIVYCYADKFGKKDINEFPKIVFNKYKYNFNISFKNEDLFYFKDNKYFCKIFCKYNQYKRFALGRIFLKNYLTVFNAEKKQIYFYNKINKENINKTFLEKNKNLILALMIIGFIIFLFAGIVIGKFLFKERKKHANELNDKYEYKAKNNTSENLYNPEEEDEEK